MNWLEKIRSLISAPAPAGGNTLWVAVRCRRCGETLRARVNLYNDLSLEYEQGGRATYFCRKVLIGENRCFQTIELSLTFDENRRLIEKQVSNGEFIEESV